MLEVPQGRKISTPKAPFRDDSRNRTLHGELHRLLNRRDLSQADLAKSVGVSKTTVLRWLSGTAKPNRDQLSRLILVGLRHARPNWTNIDMIPRNRIGSRPIPPDGLRAAVRKTLRLRGTACNFQPSPYVYNGPPNQLGFFETLYTLQEAGSQKWEGDLKEFLRRLSCVKTIGQSEQSFAVAQHLLERPEEHAAHWNTGYGSHGWHRYVGRFPPHLVRALLNTFGAGRDDVVCDPFLGSGTTAVECRYLGIPFVGCDICPLSALIARVKSLFPADPSVFERLVHKFTKRYSHGEAAIRKLLGKRFSVNDVLDFRPSLLPRFPNAAKWFTPEALLGVALTVSIAKSLRPGFERDALLVALSARMRSIGNVDVDVVRAEYSREPRKNVNVHAMIIDTLRSYGRDVRDILESHAGLVDREPQVRVEVSDARKIHLAKKSISHVITSPPYGVEAISYLRTHLLSYRTLASFLKTDPYRYEVGIIGSEYVDGAATIDATDVEQLQSPTGKAFFGALCKTGAYHSKLAARTSAMLKFFTDIADVIQLMREWLRDNGRVGFIMGNKRLGEEIIPTNDILRELFEFHGFRHDQIIRHKLKCNNSNSQVPWQERTIQEEYIMLFTKK